MFSEHGFSALVRGYRLSLSVRGLRPSTVQSYVRDVERFTSTLNGSGPKNVTAADLREYARAHYVGAGPQELRSALPATSAGGAVRAGRLCHAGCVSHRVL